ncbi:MAG: NUDIX domain-containing protein [Treponema sp.]|nr:NUDIX domain-containing protein [Treponema sp.]
MKTPHISVAGIALRGDRVFIARRVPGGSLGSKWEFPGGKAEAGEGGEEALIREFQEEFSLAIRVGEKLGEAAFEHRGLTRSLWAYRIYADLDESGGSLALRCHEAWKWASIPEIETLDFAPSDLLLLPALKTYLASRKGARTGVPC